MAIQVHLTSHQVLAGPGAIITPKKMPSWISAKAAFSNNAAPLGRATGGGISATE